MLRSPHISVATVSPLKFLVALLCAFMLVLGAGAAAAQAGPEYRGAQVHSLWSTVSAAEMTEELNALQNAGVNVLRVDVGWATLETAKGRYDSTYLAKLDALSAGASARGIKIIATLWQTPSWASSGGAWNDPPSNPADYGAFARFIAGRYGSELAAVEAWNEPEINEDLVAPNVAAVYVPMVKAFYTGAKEGDPSVPVLAGSLAYADISFLKELYADGIQGYYDGISVHPYADGAAPANTSVTHSFLGGIESLHAAQLAAGDNTPEWVTEFGWPTGTSKGANTEQQQAEYTEQAFALVNNLSYVQAATVYELRDMETNPADPEDNFGMLHQNFQPTPAYAALKAAMQAPSAGSGSSQPVSGTPGSESGTGSSNGPSLPASPPEASAPSSDSPGSSADSSEASSTGSGNPSEAGTSTTGTSGSGTSSSGTSGGSSSGSGSSGSDTSAGHGGSVSGGGRKAAQGGRGHYSARMASAGVSGHGRHAHRHARRRQARGARAARR